MSADVGAGDGAGPDEVLLANQLYFSSHVEKYERHAWLTSGAIRRHYEDLFERELFSGAAPSDVRSWQALDIGCGTGFLVRTVLRRMSRVVAADATLPMVAEARGRLGPGAARWLVADAFRQPWPRETFDLVCANALLHHVYDYETCLARIAETLRPGGRLFVGYEPNARAYRLVRPLLVQLVRLLPSHLRGWCVPEARGAGAAARLGGKDVHALAEYHIFHGSGLDPHRLSALLRERGFTRIRIHFTSLPQLVLLRDAGLPVAVDRLPAWVSRLAGPFSLSFHITARKEPG